MFIFSTVWYYSIVLKAHFESFDSTSFNILLEYIFQCMKAKFQFESDAIDFPQVKNKSLNSQRVNHFSEFVNIHHSFLYLELIDLAINHESFQLDFDLFLNMMIESTNCQ